MVAQAKVNVNKGVVKAKKMLKYIVTNVTIYYNGYNI